MPPGTRVQQDLAYVPNGHERQKLDLYVPPSTTAKPPLIIWVHGGAWLVGSKADCQVARTMVGHGYALACINYRLSQQALFPAQIQDCQQAVRWLRSHADDDGFDGERIGVWGESAGGHLVALLGTAPDDPAWTDGRVDVSSRVQAVVDWYGPTDFAKMGGTHDDAHSPEARLIGGAVQDHLPQVAVASPLTYITPDDAPFLILHGDRDDTVPFEQSELLVNALRAAKVGVDFYSVRGAGHGGPAFHGAANGPVMQQVVDFFASHLKTPAVRSAATPSQK